jgi:diguanylate cyclase
MYKGRDKLKEASLKQWVQKLIEQLQYEPNASDKDRKQGELSEDRATILFLIDIYNKHLIEIDAQPVRRVREYLDEFARELMNTDKTHSEKTLFRFRQFFSGYRVNEYTYVQKSFDDFRGILWDLIDQLGEDFRSEQTEDKEIGESLHNLKEAVEANSINDVKFKAREFIDTYVEHQSRRERRRSKRMHGIKKNLDVVKQQLNEANRSMRVDHLTEAYNRKSFDEKVKQEWQLHAIGKNPVTILTLDIDHFKKINDTYGHDVGDFVLKECVGTLKSLFHRSTDFVARVGGEEFAVVLPDYALEHAVIKAEEALSRIRKEVYITGEHQLSFTISMGIAQLLDGESIESWIKRADQALYSSKQTGRNRFTVAPHTAAAPKAA